VDSFNKRMNSVTVSHTLYLAITISAMVSGRLGIISRMVFPHQASHTIP